MLFYKAIYTQNKVVLLQAAPGAEAEKVMLNKEGYIIYAIIGVDNVKELNDRADKIGRGQDEVLHRYRH